ncbi:MAG: efflux RND transporter periplasmic adaptor subunit [Caulobacteraceae bacterium]|nr:efflux RND transporter periplasmic adaptor subunit [Caulobacteraceae bacterium]
MRSIVQFAAAALGLVLITAVTACGPSSEDQAPPPMFTDANGVLTVPAGSPLRAHLVVQTLGGASAGRLIEMPAMVEADPALTTNILSPLTGRVIALKVGIGSEVRRGQALAVLASGDLAQAYSDDDKAKDALDLAQKQLDRAKGVQEAGGNAGKDLEAAQSAYTQADAEYVRAHARLLSLNGAGARDRRNLVLTAPENGVVTTLALSKGAQVSDPTATLMTIADLDRVFVTANAPEADVGAVRAGMDADIVLTAHPDAPLHAKISQVDEVLQPDTRRQKVRIALANPTHALLPNMYATVKIVAPAAGAAAVTVPQSALLMNNDTISVLVEVRPWVFQRRPVRLGDEDANTAQVLSGLQAGDRVVVKGGVLLND